MSISQNKDAADSVMAYGTGAFGLTVAGLADIAEAAQQLTVIFACGVVFLRLCYDAVKFYRYLKTKSRKPANDP